MQPKQDDDYAGHLCKDKLVTRQQLADFGRNRTQCDKHNAETQDEHHRVQHHFAEKMAF